MPGNQNGCNSSFYVIGLGFGDEGKGSIVDYLSRRYNIGWNVRFNGGPQAAHHVVTPKGKLHCFSQFGSGSLHPVHPVRGTGVKSYLSPFMLVDPLSLEKEETALRYIGITDGFQRLFLNEECVVITPFHAALNRIRELSRGEHKHGSCGKGVSDAYFDSKNKNIPSIKVADFSDVPGLTSKLKLLGLMKIDLAEQLYKQGLNEAIGFELKKLKANYLPRELARRYHDFVQKIRVISQPGEEDLLREEKTILFEGAQGVLLDQRLGFFPYVTPSNTTLVNASKIGKGIGGQKRRIGVIRLYAVRHGAGPFVTEDKWLTGLLPETHNIFNPWQEAMRCGWLDLVATRYAIKAAGIDEIAVTNIDRLTNLKCIKICRNYRLKNPPDYADEFFNFNPNEPGIIDDIKSTEDNNLENRRLLTHLLSRCEPVYDEFPMWKMSSKKDDLLNEQGFRDVLALLQSEIALNCKISLISTGPTIKDKLEL
ncbi:MAG: adenylosuccinate synthetase [bacterium]|nr:adenylosuccinate synthetase [bacterium]